MKKIFAIFAVAAVCAGCAKQIENPSDNSLSFTPKSFYASVDGTKTALDTDGKTVTWKTDDKIGVFYKDQLRLMQYKLYAEGEAESPYNKRTSGYFMYTNCNIELSVAPDQYYAIYPWNQDATLSNGVITTSLPATQTASVTEFDPDAAVLACRSTREALDFQNVEGLVKLSLRHSFSNVTNVGVKEVIFTSSTHPLTGSASIDAKSSQLKAVVADNGGKTVTVICDNPEPIALHNDFDTPIYIVIPETQFASGDVTIQVWCELSSSASAGDTPTIVYQWLEFNVNKAFAVTANNITTITKTVSETDYQQAAN